MHVKNFEFMFEFNIKICILTNLLQYSPYCRVSKEKSIFPSLFTPTVMEMESECDFILLALRYLISFISLNEN